MPKFRVYYQTGAATSIAVEADSMDEAIEVADQEVHVTLCHQCSGDLDVSDVWEFAEAVEIDQ